MNDEGARPVPTPAADVPRRLRERVRELLAEIYPEHDRKALEDAVLAAFFGPQGRPRRRGRPPGNALWSERDGLVITYGDTFIDGTHKPLDLLNDFLRRHLRGVINGVHILPFFPWTSDDGFAVTDYEAVNPALGDWEDISRIASEFRLMSDLVLNHVSGQSRWFNAYLQGHSPYDRFFFEALPEDDLSAVVRPRVHPLLREVETANGSRHVWCTFSHDQVDLDFSNPEVLLEFLRIMRLHIDRGARIIRLDAVAFVWKEPGTSCIHLPETHAIVRLMRALADFAQETVILLTETNVPNAENLSYFGNRNEAHAIYNFSLPPLMLHALLTGSSRYLNAWQMAMPPAQLGCAYLNFIASHDGIGMRPAEGLIPDEEIIEVIDTVRGFGGLVSARAMPDGGERVYELNVALIDALKGTVKGEDRWGLQRFLCAHTVMMALEGIPAFYIHSLLGTPNDLEGVERTGRARSINRRRWHYPTLLETLADPASPQAVVLNEMKRRIGLRIRQPAFHPNATQFTLQLGDRAFGFWRQSLDRAQSIFCIANLSDEALEIPVNAINLIGGHDWWDPLSGDRFGERRGTIEFAPYQCRWITNRA